MLIIARTTGVQTVVMNGNGSNIPSHMMQRKYDYNGMLTTACYLVVGLRLGLELYLVPGRLVVTHTCLYYLFIYLFIIY